MYSNFKSQPLDAPIASHSSAAEDWVRMYREGVTCAGIAQLCGENDIMMILRIVAEAKRRDASLEEAHLANRLGAGNEVSAYVNLSADFTPGWEARLEQLRGFVQQHGRMPRQRGGDQEETSLGRWLHAQRGKVDKGSLSTQQRAALDATGNWDSARRVERDRLSFPDRLRQTAAFRARHKRWPTYMTRADPDERSLGIWLHTFRQAAREGRLPDQTRQALDRYLPGWNP